MRNAVTTISLLGLLGLGLLAGCPDRTISEVTPNQGRVEYKDIPVTVNRDIDILFVIDDSPSMLDKQTNLKNNFPNFINVLNTIEGGLPNVHLGVVSSDLGTKGADDAQAGPAIGSGGPGSCSGNGKSGNLQTNGTPLVSGTFISDIKNQDGTRTTNYMGSLADAFSAIASLGASGCGFEQHLEAAKRALNNNPANAGFLRPNAYLALVFIQDEDDCSIAHSTLLGSDTTTLGPLQSFRCNRFGHVCQQGGQSSDQMNQIGPKGDCSSNENSAYLTKVANYVTFFKGLKADPSNVIVAGIAGPTTPYEVELRTPPGGGSAIPAIAHSCTYNGAAGPEVADPSVRLKDFLDAFPNRSTFSTICQQDLSGALIQIAQLLKLVIGSPCIDGKLADVDPTTPGPQYDCSVSDVTHYGQPNQTETVLPQCNNSQMPSASTNKPCWSIQVDPKCGGPGMLTLKVERNEMPAPDTHVISYCVTEGN
jgi:hypothetical protein